MSFSFCWYLVLSESRTYFAYRTEHGVFEFRDRFLTFTGFASGSHCLRVLVKQIDEVLLYVGQFSSRNKTTGVNIFKASLLQSFPLGIELFDVIQTVSQLALQLFQADLFQAIHETWFTRIQTSPLLGSCIHLIERMWRHQPCSGIHLHAFVWNQESISTASFWRVFCVL